MRKQLIWILSLMIGTFTALSTQATTTTTLKGFLEAQYNWLKSDDFKGIGNANSGHHIKDGALYFSHESENALVFVDLPFVGESIDANGDGIIDSGTSTNNILIGQGKAQAYIKYSAGNAFFQMGLFDAIIGYEASDSLDRFFVTEGLLASYSVPTSHNGLMVGYKFNEQLNIKALSGNKEGVNSKNETFYETALQVQWETEMYRASFGYLIQPDYDAAGDSAQATQMSLVLGGTWGPLNADLEYEMKNYIEGTNLTDGDGEDVNSGTALLAHLTYDLNDLMGLGLRYEMLDKVNPFWKATGMALGMNYKLNENLKTRLEYGQNSYTRTDGGDAQALLFAGLSAVYSF